MKQNNKEMLIIINANLKFVTEHQMLELLERLMVSVPKRSQKLGIYLSF